MTGSVVHSLGLSPLDWSTVDLVGWSGFVDGDGAGANEGKVGSCTICDDDWVLLLAPPDGRNGGAAGLNSKPRAAGFNDLLGGRCGVDPTTAGGICPGWSGGPVTYRNPGC